MAANAWYVPDIFSPGECLAKNPQVLHEHKSTAYPANACLIGTVLPNGFAQITPRGSTMVFDDEHIALWERGKGTTTEKSYGWDAGHDLHAPAGVARGRHSGEKRHPAAYGTAKVHKSGPVMKRSGTVSSRRRRRATRKRRAMPSSLRSREQRICRVSR